VRVVAATHRRLDAMVESGSFRADLRARLAGYTLRLPPLRDRKEDLGLLVGRLLERHAPATAAATTFSVPAARALVAYPWPGNVRELEKVLETAIALAGPGGVIDVRHLPEALLTMASSAVERPGYPSTVPPHASSSAKMPRVLTPDEERLKAELEELLRAHGGNISAVARATGKARNQIQRWIRRFSIGS
jgi:transcriptional regulator of acetoin/glycerol metabolism